MENILVVTTDATLQGEVEDLGQDNWFCLGTVDEIKDSIGEDPVTIVIDLADKTFKDISKKMQSYLERDNCKCIVLCRNVTSREIRKHQESASSFHAYLTTPFDLQLLLETIQDLNLDTETDGDESSIASAHSGKAGVKVSQPNQGEITFIGLSAKDKTNRAIKTPVAPDADIDDSFGEAEDLEENADAIPDTEDLSSGVREIIQAHSENNVVADGRSQQKIQEKFDAVFGMIDYDDLKAAPPPVQEEAAPEVKVDLFNENDNKAEEMVSTDSDSQKDEIGLDDLMEGNTNIISLKSAKSGASMSENKKDEGELDISFDVDEALDIGGDDAKPAEIKAPSKASNDSSLDAPEELSFDVTETEDENSGAMLESPKGESAAPVEGGLDLGSSDAGEFEITGSGGNSASMSESESTVMVKSSDLDLGAQDADFEIENAGAKKPKKAAAEEGEHGDLLSMAINDDGANEATKMTTKSKGGDEDMPAEFDYKTGQIARPEKNEFNIDDSLDIDANIEASDGEATTTGSDIDMDAEFNMDEDNEKTTMLASKKKAKEPSPPEDELNMDSGEDLFDASEESIDEEPVKSSGKSSKGKTERELPDPYIDFSRIPTATIKEDELSAFQGTIKSLREERESLLRELDNLKEDKRQLQRENKGLKADLDEVRIELSIIRQRHEKEVDRYRAQLSVSEEKRAIIEQKWRQAQRDLDQVGEKVRVDINQVKKREKELESKLELQAIDNQSQVKARDQKILELKRKIDSLEFNMENAAIREQQSKTEKHDVEEKLQQVMQTLRQSLQIVDEDIESMNNRPSGGSNKKV